EVPIDPASFHAIASGLFGADAQAGKLLKEKELTQGVFVTATADKSAPDQTQLTFSFDRETHKHRILAVAPASFTVGKIFIDTVDAATAKMQADAAKDPGSGEA